MSYSRIKSLVNEELKSYFRPEFLNRLDEIIVFRQLTKKEVKQIADIMLRDVFKRGEEKGIKIEVTEKFKDRWAGRSTIVVLSLYRLLFLSGLGHCYQSQCGSGTAVTCQHECLCGLVEVATCSCWYATGRIW